MKQILVGLLPFIAAFMIAGVWFTIYPDRFMHKMERSGLEKIMWLIGYWGEPIVANTDGTLTLNGHDQATKERLKVQDLFLKSTAEKFGLQYKSEIQDFWRLLKFSVTGDKDNVMKFYVLCKEEQLFFIPENS